MEQIGSAGQMAHQLYRYDMIWQSTLGGGGSSPVEEVMAAKRGRLKRQRQNCKLNEAYL